MLRGELERLFGNVIYFRLEHSFEGLNLFGVKVAKILQIRIALPQTERPYILIDGTHGQSVAFFEPFVIFPFYPFVLRIKLLHRSCWLREQYRGERRSHIMYAYSSIEYVKNLLTRLPHASQIPVFLPENLLSPIFFPVRTISTHSGLLRLPVLHFMQKNSPRPRRIFDFFRLSSRKDRRTLPGIRYGFRVPSTGVRPSREIQRRMVFSWVPKRLLTSCVE